MDRTVAEAQDGLRVDVVVSEWLGEPRAQVHKRLASGLVEVDGKTVAKSFRLRRGQRVSLLADVRTAPPPPRPVPVRWEDEALCVVAKPAGLVVHAGAGHIGPTLVDALAAAGVPLAPSTEPERPGVVHRLDRGTSGLLVVAKTEEALSGLQALFRRHAADRRYWALVDGVPDPPHATIEAPIARDPNRRTRFRVDPGGRRAVSHFDVEERFGEVSRLTVRLETGRTHQVRVHMAAVGHPVCGDRTYGASQAVADWLGLDRPALHAQRLGFAHPLTGEWIEVFEPLPDDLAAALATLRGAEGG